MTCLIKKLAKPLLLAVFILSGLTVNAQVSLFKQTFDKIKSYKNFSYQSIAKTKDYTNDTLTIETKNAFFKAPADKAMGYLFSIETLIRAEKSNWKDIYNGQELIHIVPADSTYQTAPVKPNAMAGSILDRLNWFNSFLEKNPSKIADAADTTINALACSHLIINTRDTIVNGEHYFTRIHLFIEKLSGTLNCIITTSRNADTGNATSDYYSIVRYFDYQFDQDNISTADLTIPKGFHPPKEEPASPALLARGTVAPDWVLYAADGKKISLSELKGKVILLDYFFIGCTGCMQSLKPLNNIHEKYKDKNLEIVSLTHRDSKKSVTTFGERFKVKYPIYINGGDVVKSYHVDSFPTFYFIDKEGKIADVFVGYSDDFESKVTSIIDKYL